MRKKHKYSGGNKARERRLAADIKRAEKIREQVANIHDDKDIESKSRIMKAASDRIEAGETKSQKPNNYKRKMQHK